MYFYTAYGLTIRSGIVLPELIPIEKPVHHDITIQLGTVPASLGAAASKGVVYEAHQQQFLLKIGHIAHYLIEAGKSITIQPMPDVLPSDVRVFLLATCLAVLLHQKGIFALHASAIDTEHGAILFMGPSGAGKSTLLNAFIKRGHGMFADDIAAIYLDTAQNPRIQPGFPRTKLWADAAKKLDIDTTNLPRTRPQLEKFEYYVPQKFERNTKPVTCIYLLAPNNKDDLLVETIPNMRVIQTLIQNTYRQRFLDGLDMRGEHFRLLTKVAQTVPVLKVSRPIAPYCLDELVDVLASDIETRATPVG